MKKIFSECISERGLQYYEEDRVEKVILNKDNVRATVRGTEKYNVKIDILNAGIESMSCNCKYFEGTGNCKHLASLMYYINDNCKEYMKTHEERLKQNIEKIEIEELKEFIYEKMLKERNFNKQITEKFQGYFEKADMSLYIEKIIKLKNDMLNNLITEEECYQKPCYEQECYRDKVYEYERGISDILNEVDKYSEIYDLEDYLVVVKTILENIPYIEKEAVYENYSYTYIEIMERIDEIISEYLIKLSEKYGDISKTILKLIKENINQFSSLEMYFMEYLEYLNINKKENCDIEEIIILYIKKEKYKQKHILLLSNIYDKQKREEDKIQLYINNINLYEIAEELLKIFVNKQEYTTCIKYGEQILNTDMKNALKLYEKYYPRIEFKYKILQYILESYFKMDKIKEHNDLLIEILTKYNFRKVEMYIKLKNNTSKEEWEEVYSELIKKVNDSYLLLEIYAYEKDLESMIKEIQKQNREEYAKKYEDILMPKYEEQLFDVLVSSIYNNLKKGQGRECSKKACEELAYLLKYENMKAKLEESIEMLLKTYSARRTFKDELRKYKLI